ncbi:MAG: hypothetical protein HY908_15600 [Myxococcales bacterium]|nr:hypothetical protein [Myxococcales bacterium]
MAALALAACTEEPPSDLPTGTGGVGGAALGGGGQGGGSPCELAADCAACRLCAVESACAALGAACTASPDCVAIDQCVAGCQGDPAECARICSEGSPAGAGDYFAFASCILCSSCATSCGGCDSLHCLDGITSGDETAPDCGGPSCTDCANGLACSTATDCGSGFCTDGVCCETDCTGSCAACSNDKTGVADGLCAPVAGDEDPDDECAPGACNGAGACACADGQTNLLETDVDCGGGACAPCVLGEGCALGSDCASGFCADGVCCDATCGGLCEACLAATTGGADGTCAPVPVGADPDGECADAGVGSCGLNGVCDGATSCAFYGAGSPCQDAQACAGGVETKQDTCDGVGNCVDNGTVDCAPFVCGPTACVVVCSGPGDCLPGSYCDGSACQPEKANGATCGGGIECASGHCADGVCCDTACGGLCTACTAARTGVADGTCAAVAGGSDPDGECLDQGPCLQNGSCNGLGACALYASGTVCGAAPSCAGGFENPGDSCNGSGSCVAGGIVACAPYVCGPTTCKESCTVNADCVAGYYCETLDSTCRLYKTQGAVCGGNYQCGNGNCVDGFCCSGPCAGACSACSNAKTGAANGTCAFVTNGIDPDGECNAPATDVCNGAGVCRCHDALQNGNETALNCGGLCNDCTPGQTCLAGTDCTTGYCTNGICCNEPTCGAHASCGGGGDCACSGVWQNCNGGWADGCEIDTSYDNDNCGSCFATCLGNRYECLGSGCRDLCNASQCQTWLGCASGEQCFGGTPGNPQCGAACSCAAPETLVATPAGDVPIVELAAGDLVYSLHQGRLEVVPVLGVQRSHVDPGHQMVRVTLEDGSVVEMSAGHPTADGRSFGDLAAGDRLGEARIAHVERVAYGHEHTYDLLPASDTGTYLAAGALVGSTMFGPRACVAR